MQDIPLIIFAKAPVPGKVKTRLHDKCSAETAAYVAELLLTHIVELACDHWQGEVIISVAGEIQHPVIVRLYEEYPVDCISQLEGDLGQRMHHAFEQVGRPAAIIGADVPACSAATLQNAWQSLANGNNVIGPALDGGYYLIGLQQPFAELFENVDWGTANVYQQTLTHADDASLSLQTLEYMSDLDTWSDIEALVNAKPEAIPALTKLCRDKL